MTSPTTREARTCWSTNMTSSCVCFPRLVQTHSSLMIGLDHAGKSSICSWLETDRRDDSIIIMPTSVPKCHFFRRDPWSCHWRLWDMPGRGPSRELWHLYLGHVESLIFVLDALDVARVAVARDEFWLTLAQEQQPPKKILIPTLVFLNKSHKEEEKEDSTTQVVTSEQVESIFQLKTRLGLGMYRIQRCSGHTGKGIDEGLRWLASSIETTQSRR